MCESGKVTYNKVLREKLIEPSSNLKDSPLTSVCVCVCER